ncbi:hypothetical protein QA811_24045 [Streptomyces sp. B21-102]|uniref:hypothetical protein n=1 Tax=unclassified Streptomyces TaxID=2593676 RepID=UPI002FEF6F2C
MNFVSQDGRHRKTYDFAVLPGPQGVSEDLAVAFEAVTGPLGSWTRLGGAGNLWQSARQASKWVQETRPGLTGLAGLTPADARLLGLSFQVPSGNGLLPSLRALIKASPVISREAQDALARVRIPRRQTSRQPYTDLEFRQINAVARGMARRARTRLRTNWALLADYRAGRLGSGDPRGELAEVLDHCARTGGFPVLDSGSQTMATRRAARAANGRPVNTHLYLSASEAWAFGVLLAGRTSLNLSVLAELPATHLRATAPSEPGIALVRASKPRRHSRSEMTLPMDSLHPDLRPSKDDQRSPHVLSTSLTTAFGVFMLLVELTDPGRRLLGTDRAFIYYSAQANDPGLLRTGLPNAVGSRKARQGWLGEWLTGDSKRDEVLLGISFDRLRKTHLERNRKPVAHTPDTLARYLRRMHTVTKEGFQIVREALDEQVEAALARRRMVVTDAEQDDGPAEDTALGACTDIEAPPHSPGRRCGLGFWSCLDCGNARAFPRHLPLQLLAIEELDLRRASIGTDRWVAEFAGRRAQLVEIVSEYEPAQIAAARSQTTATHRRIIDLLLSGDLDPL